MIELKGRLKRKTVESVEQGFRLGCQTKVTSDGEITVHNKPYF
ncbi:hypothetical protein [Paenibacillus ginsengarvi]|nr:hypothetical protein [Paenibacillus ginsengarvi]